MSSAKLKKGLSQKDSPFYLTSKNHPDGYIYINANRFYWMWFDVFYFGKTTWLTMIAARQTIKKQP
ncbi:MAG: hypothetical protein PHW04_07730 [Candidatus Wallbacteria bacterium]|nr:hypothetical protein [Candidatus Wallbacteria bacterium]